MNKKALGLPMTAFDLAMRFMGTTEVRGQLDNPQVMAFLTADAGWPEHDEVPWCSGFVNYIAKLMRLPRSKSLRARSWLEVGRPILDTEWGDQSIGYTTVILKRGHGDQPGPEVINAPGHVGWLAGYDADRGLVHILGGNQSNQVSVAAYSANRILGVRDLIG